MPEQDITALTTYETFKALPRSKHPYRQEDLDMMAEILRTAEIIAQNELQEGIGSGELNLLRLLKAYELVLRKHDVVPAEDTYFYRFLLKLSLDPDTDWWAKFNRECQRNAEWSKSQEYTYVRDVRLLSACWLRWRSQVTAGQDARASYHTFQPHDQSDVQLSFLSLGSNEEERSDGAGGGAFDMDVPAYTEFKLLAATFRVWQKQVSELKRLEKERYRELENWKIALTFGEERLGQRYFARWRAYPQRRLAVAAKFLFSSSLARNFAYWQHVVGHLRQCRGKAADFFTMMTFKRTWSTWKESIRFSKDTKLKLNSALSFWSDKAMQGSFTQWCILCDHRAQLTSKAEAYWTQKYKKKTWDLFRVEVGRQKFLGTAEESAEAYQNHGTKVRFWAKWRSKYNTLMKHEEILQRCFAKMRQAVLSAAFTGWHTNVVRLMDQAEKIRVCLKKMTQRHLAGAMRTWHDWYAKSLDLKGKALTIVTRLRFSTLASAFATWLEWYDDRLEKRAKLLTCVQRIKNGTLVRCFESWRKHVGELRRLFEVGQQCVRRIINVKKAAAWNAWVSWLETHLHHQNVVRRCLQRIIWRVAYTAFDAWVERIRQINYHQELFESIRALPTRRIARMHFDKWAAKYNLVLKLRHCVKTMQMSCVIKVFRQWHGTTVEHKVQAQKVVGALRKMMNRALASTWGRWLEYVEESKELKYVAAKALGRLLMRVTASAFSTWVAHAAYKRDLRARLQPVLARLKNQALSVAFDSFKANVLEEGEKRDALAKAVTYWQNMAIRSCFDPWHAFIVNKRIEMEKLKAAVAKIMHGTLFRCLNAWSLNVKQRASERARLMKAARLLINHRMSKAMNT